jgi:hypothetical protein
VQTTTIQALDLGFVIHHLGTANHQNAPPGSALLVIVIRLERGQILTFGRGELRPAGRAKDWVLPVNDMVHRQEHDFAIREKTDPPYWDRGQQPKALVIRQYLKPGMIGRMLWHVTLH